jgi:hypothetical protein
MTFLFPVLASLVVFPLHDLTKLLGKQEYSLDAAILYMSAPAILLMPLIRDQAIFPLVAIFSLVVAVKAALTKSLPLAFLTGILLYISTFLSFSLLPIIALTYAFHIFIGFRDRDHIPPIRTVLLIGGITIGIIFMWSMGNSILSYNPIVRYQAALQHHSTNKDFVADLPHLMRYALTNSLEFVMAIGIPIFELFLVHGIQSLLRGVRKTASNMDIFTLATLGTLVVLQLAGQTQGETARLWLFMVPIVAIIASVPVRHMQAKTKIAFIMVFALQILLSVMTFMNMDFH